MILESKTFGGFRSKGGGALVTKGRNEFEYRSLTRAEQQFIDVIVKARLAEIVEEDGPIVPVALHQMEPYLAPLDPPEQTQVQLKPRSVGLSQETEKRIRKAAKA